jgi:hypothetical protein
LLCDASGIAAMLFVLLYFVVGLSSSLDLLLSLLPLAVHDTLEFTLGMKHIAPHLNRPRWGLLWLLSRCGPRLVGEFHPARKPLPRIGDDTLYTGPVQQHFTPTFSRAIRSTLPRNPRHTMRFHHHQNGGAMEEDFIQTQHQY